MIGTAIQWSLSRFLEDVAEANQYANVYISGICQTDQEVERGDLFLALAGRHRHGLEFAGKAKAAGIAAVGWEPHEHVELPSILNDIPCIRIENLSARVGKLAARFYDHPSEHLKILAVTGTDGKSSVSIMLAQALQELHHNCGVIGTLGVGLPGALRPSRYTTPPQTVLQKALYRMLREDDCRHVAIEASSHALDQQRFSDVNIDTAILTNITRDHLDYHQDREHYIAAKSRLFFESDAANCVVNIDDETGRSWVCDLQKNSRVLTYSTQSSSSRANEHFFARSIRAHAEGLSFELMINGKGHDVSMPLFGKFNIHNALAVAATLYAQGFSAQDTARALNRLTPVTGRMQTIRPQSGPAIVIDYAHTPAALEAALNSVRDHFNGVLYCVFGCGGNRDRGKRSQMGDVAARLADRVILTSDNPRDEDPMEILKDIAGKHDRFVLEVDRRQAIQLVLQQAQLGDVVLIAGKGHENTQEVAGEFLEFSDYDQVNQILRRGLSHA